MKIRTTKSFVAALVALAMLVSAFSGIAFAAGTALEAVGEARLIENDRYTGESGNTAQNVEQKIYRGTTIKAADDIKATDDNEIVDIMVELDGAPALKVKGSVKAAASYEAKLLEDQKAMQAKIENAIGKKIDVMYNHTLLFNGFSFRGEFGLIAKINELDGVVAFRAPEFDNPTPKTATSTGLVSATEAWALGYNGEGTLIAIIDTGIRPTHEAFSVAPENPAMSQQSLAAIVAENSANLNCGTDAAQLYYSAKIPFRYNYYTSAYNANHGASDHGTHVAGIAAGNNGDDFKGVAPEAQILAMQVFSSSGGASWSTILPALEDCAYLGVDSANMSLGSACGFSTYYQESYEEVFALLTQAGVNLAVAAGNDNATLENNAWNGYAPVTNLDYGVVGSPSTWPESLSVAAADNATTVMGHIEVNGASFGYVDRASNASEQLTSIAGEHEYVICGLGLPEDYENVDIAGKIAVVSRGDISFTEKVANAANAGAIGVIVVNNQAGSINMQVDNYLVPAVSVLQKYMADFEAGNGTLSIVAGEFLDLDLAGQTTSFSSRGTTADLKIKPEIIAPGGNINSAIGFGSDNSYEAWNGTSMAAPHVAGGMALVKEYVNANFSGYNAEQKLNLIDALLMSTATPIKNEAGVTAFVREQGAGMMNLGAAVRTHAYLSTSSNVRPKLEIGSDANWTGVFNFNFNVTNFGYETLKYKLGFIGLTEQPTNGETAMLINGTELDISEWGTFETNFENDTVIVPAGESVAINAKFTMDADAIASLRNIFADGIYFEGFVTLESLEVNGVVDEDLSIPFLGFLGDWNYPSMIDCGYYWQDVTGEANNGTHPVPNTVGYKKGNTIQGLGINPYAEMPEGTYLEDRNAISPNGDGILDSVSTIYTGMIRNQRYGHYAINYADGTQNILDSWEYNTKGYYYGNGGYYDQIGVNYGAFPGWDASTLADGESATIEVRGDLDNAGYTTAGNKMGAWLIPVTKDLTAPELTAAAAEGNVISAYFEDANYIAYIAAYADEAMSNLINDIAVFETERGATTLFAFNAPENAEFVYFFVGDYAGNERAYKFEIATGTATEIDATPGGGDDQETIWWEENFDVFPLQSGNWLAADGDGDNHKWGIFTNNSEMAYGGTGGFAGSESYCVTHQPSDGALTPNNWFITPAIEIPADGDFVLRFQVSSTNYQPEHLAVLVGPENVSNTSDFTTTLMDEDIANLDYAQKEFSLAQYAGQKIRFAFRHYDCTDQMLLRVDEIQVVKKSAGGGDVTDIPDGYAAITLKTDDVWGDGSGYQMLLDADASAYGTLIPTSGPLTSSGDAPAGLYDNFEYKIPENADGSLTTSNMICNSSATILVPAGVYDYCIANPTPGDRIWIASNYGTANGREDDYTFENQKHYIFHVQLQGQYDAVNLEIIGGGGGTPDPTPGDAFVGWYFESQSEVNEWTFVDKDGDGYNWTWNQLNTAPEPYEGAGCIYSNSFVNYFGAVNPDNWAISPEFTIPANASSATLSWYAAPQDPDWTEEHYGVYVGTGTDTANYTQLFEETISYSDYKNTTVDLTAYAGQTIRVAFRHFNCTDMFMLKLDQVEVMVEEGGEPGPGGDELVSGWYFESQSEVNEWTFVDKDGDGYNWMWNQLNEAPTPYEGAGCIYSNSFVNYFGAVNPDNWAISPEFTIPANASSATLSWYAAPQDPDWTEEHYGVYVGTGTDTANYTQLFEETISYSDYKNTTVDLTAYAGQTIRVAFRHFNCTDMFILKLDQVEVFATAGDQPVEEYTVTFVDGLTSETIDTQIVVAGEDAVAPEAPVHEGYTFVEWDTDFTNVQSDLTVTAVYAINEYTVTFVDGLTGETIDTQTVEHGADAVEPAVPEHVGYHFVEWDVEFTNVTSDLTVTALYEINTYNVHIRTTSCGTASPIGDIVVEHGDDLTINMTPDANHYVWYVAVNGEIVAVRPGNVITINDITEDLDIYIVFNTDAPEVTPPTPAPTPGKPPKTGAISMTAIAIMAIASGAGIVLFRKK